MIRLILGAALIWTLAALPPAFAERSGPGDVGDPPTASNTTRKTTKRPPRSIKEVLTQLTEAVNARDLAKGLSLFPSDAMIDQHVRCVDPEKGPRKQLKREREKFARKLKKAPPGFKVRYLSHAEKKVERFPKGTVNKGCTLLADVTVRRVEIQMEITRLEGKKTVTKKKSDAITLMRFGQGHWYTVDL